MLRPVSDDLAEPRPVDRLLAPLRNFLHTEASGGLLLMAAAMVALVWANSPFAASYELLWNTPLALRIGQFGLTESLHFWINDGLMAIFFLVVGLEIKREVLIGELTTLRMLPPATA
jgi:NhaA family Na+:H+ antiporter